MSGSGPAASTKRMSKADDVGMLLSIGVYTSSYNLDFFQKGNPHLEASLTGLLTWIRTSMK